MAEKMAEPFNRLPAVQGLISPSGKKWALEQLDPCLKSTEKTDTLELALRRVTFPCRTARLDDRRIPDGREGIWSSHCQGQPVIFKIGLLDEIVHEASIYKHLQQLQGIIVPKLHGVYKLSGSDLAGLVLQDCGSPVYFPETHAEAAAEGDIPVTTKCVLMRP